MSIGFKYGRHWTTREVYYTGWTYNATPASRAAITDAIKIGYVMCMDPEAYADFATIGLDQSQFATDGRLIAPVTKPATAILTHVAGIVVGFAAGYAGSGAGRLILATSGLGVPAFVKANVSSYDVLLAAANNSWNLEAVAVGTNGANIPLVAAKPLEIGDTSSTAALKRVNFGCLGAAPVAA